MDPRIEDRRRSELSSRAARRSSRYPEVVFLDLDNTLYDWLSFYAAAIRGMVYRLSELSGVPVSVLFSEFREVFSEFGSVEYSFALQELPSLQDRHPNKRGAELADEFLPAIKVYQQRRRRFLRLYPGVERGLRELNELGIRCIGVTDSHAFQSRHRLRQLGIQDLLELAAQPSHEVAHDVERIRQRDDQAWYSAPMAEIHVLPEGLRKPQVKLLEGLMTEVGVGPDRCVFVGDNLLKDVAMAQSAGVLDCWAAYGCRQSAFDFATLAKVTHWSADAVAAAADPTPENLGVNPTVTAQSFDDIMTVVTDSKRWRTRHSRSLEVAKKRRTGAALAGRYGGTT